MEKRAAESCVEYLISVIEECEDAKRVREDRDDLQVFVDVPMTLDGSSKNREEEEAESVSCDCDTERSNPSSRGG